VTLLETTSAPTTRPSASEVRPSSTQLATEASFQALANCYLREVDAGHWHEARVWRACTGIELEAQEGHVVELDLPPRGLRLAIGVAYRSRAGRHTLTVAYRHSAARQAWEKVDLLSAELLLIDAVYARHPESQHRLELINRLVESHQVMGVYLESWLERGVVTPPKDFIQSEQSVVLGHWLHPTPKSRQGIQAWQHQHYAPELGARFQLHFFAVQRELLVQASVAERSAEEIGHDLAFRRLEPEAARQLSRALGSEFCPIPLHPLQAEWLLHQMYVQELLTAGRILDLGRLGPTFTPTSSVRTLYAADEEFMVKLSIPVKITNSLRCNLKSELGDSVWVTKLLRQCEAIDPCPRLLAIEDPAYLSVALPGREETGFEVIFRRNPFRGAAGNDEVHSIAALVQEPLPPRRRSRLAELVEQLAACEGLSLGHAGRAWFDDYFRCAIESVIRTYDAHGVGLEAHQQNVLLMVLPSGRPSVCYYRDIQGLALAESARARTLELVPELASQPKVFEPDEIVRNGLGYYLIFNQLCAVVNRFGVDGLLTEEELLGSIRERLLLLKASMRGPGVELIDAFLQQRMIACKANLLTRANDVDELEAENELGVYCMVDNPLALEFAPGPMRQVYPLSGHQEVGA